MSEMEMVNSSHQWDTDDNKLIAPDAGKKSTRIRWFQCLKWILAAACALLVVVSALYVLYSTARMAEAISAMEARLSLYMDTCACAGPRKNTSYSALQQHIPSKAAHEGNPEGENEAWAIPRNEYRSSTPGPVNRCSENGLQFPEIANNISRLEKSILDMCLLFRQMFAKLDNKMDVVETVMKNKWRVNDTFLLSLVQNKSHLTNMTGLGKAKIISMFLESMLEQKNLTEPASPLTHAETIQVDLEELIHEDKEQFLKLISAVSELENRMEVAEAVSKNLTIIHENLLHQRNSTEKMTLMIKYLQDASNKIENLVDVHVKKTEVMESHLLTTIEKASVGIGGSVKNVDLSSIRSQFAATTLLLQNVSRDFKLGMVGLQSTIVTGNLNIEELLRNITESLAPGMDYSTGTEIDMATSHDTRIEHIISSMYLSSRRREDGIQGIERMLDDFLDNVTTVVTKPSQTIFCSKTLGCEVQNLESNKNFRCFKVVGDNLSWNDAMFECKKESGYLAEVTDKATMMYIKKISRNHNRLWLGGKDSHEENVWKWVHSGKSFTVEDWNIDQPDDYNNAEDCVEIVYAARLSEHRWNDVPCSYRLGYICEKWAPSCSDWM